MKKYYDMAIDRGFRSSMYNLAKYYEEVEKNNTSSYYYYSLYYYKIPYQNGTEQIILIV